MEKNTDFLNQRYSYGIILVGSIEDIQKLRATINKSGLKPVYQTTSATKLKIIQV
jgi:hypothetical protein